jgi:hypothetical protein
MKKFSILIVLICICIGFSGCALFVPVWECLTEPYPSTTYYYYGGCYHTTPPPPTYCGYYHRYNGHYHSGHYHRPHKPKVTHTHSHNRNGHTHRPNSNSGSRNGHGGNNRGGQQGGRGHKR